MAHPAGTEDPAAAPDLALLALEAARESLGRFLESARQTQELIGQSADVSACGAKELQEKAVQHADEHLQLSFQLAQGLIEAKDDGELLEVQKEFAQKTAEVYRRQFQELSRLVTRFTPKASPGTEP
jgi:hypothetical protein